MRYSILLCSSSLFLQLASFSLADPPAAPSPAIEARIRAADEDERKAILANDVPALERLWSVGIVVNNPQNGITPNRDALLQRVREGKIHYSSFERHIEAMRASGDDLVIVMGGEKVVPAAPAPNAGQTVMRRFTDLWKQENGSWTLIARQATIVPEPRP